MEPYARALLQLVYAAASPGGPRAEVFTFATRLTRLTRDVGLAEDLAQDALVAALERWPRTGIPDNPGAWLMLARSRKACSRRVPDPVGTVS